MNSLPAVALVTLVAFAPLAASVPTAAAEPLECHAAVERSSPGFPLLYMDCAGDSPVDSCSAGPVTSVAVPVGGSGVEVRCTVSGACQSQQVEASAVLIAAQPLTGRVTSDIRCDGASVFPAARGADTNGSNPSFEQGTKATGQFDC